MMSSRRAAWGSEATCGTFRTFVDEDKREGGYFKDYGFLRATFGVTFSF